MLARTPPDAQRSPAQRSYGAGTLAVRAGPGGTNRLADLAQSGCARLRLPRPPHGSTRPLEAVAINTSGGLTGGDRLAWNVRAEAGAAASLTSQGCERIYRSAGGSAEVSIALDVEAGATLLWWPQETIVFDGGALARRLDAVVAPGATLLVVEAMLFGRAAMGERMERADLRDAWNVRRPDGTLVHAERLRLRGAGDLEEPASTNGAHAVATLLLVSPDAESRLEDARAVLGPEGCVSCWGGRLLARIVAENGYRLRRSLVPLAALLGGRDVPRGWGF